MKVSSLLLFFLAFLTFLLGLSRTTEAISIQDGPICSNLPSYWNSTIDPFDGLQYTLPYGYLKASTTVDKFRYSFFIYDYWGSSSGWISLGFSNELTQELPLPEDATIMDEQRSELSNVTLYVVFKDSRARERDGQFAMRVNRYLLKNSSDWTTLIPMPFASSESKPKAFFDSDSMMDYTRIFMDFDPNFKISGVNLPDMKYVMTALNPKGSSKKPEQLNATSQFVQPMISSDCKVLAWDIEYMLSSLTLYSVAPFLIVVAVLFPVAGINALLLLCTCKSLRVRSRMPTLLISVGLLFMVHVFDIITFIFAFMRNGLLAQIFWALSMAFFALTFWNYFMMFLRYFHVRNVYNLISVRKNQTTKQMGRMLKFHKRLSSRITFTILTVIFAMAMALVFGLIGHSLDPASLNRNYQASICRFVITCVMFIVLVIALIVDLVLNFKTIKSKGVKYYLLFDDPLHFRIELMSSIFIPINSLILMILEIVFYKEMNDVTEARLSKQLVLGIVRAVFFLLQFLVYYWTAGGGGTIFFDRIMVYKPHIISLITGKPIATRLIDTADKSLIEEFLTASDEHLQLLEDYCQKEFSSENVMLWKMLYAIKREGFTTIEKAIEIRDDYIATGSMLEVNIEGKVRKELLAQLKELIDKNTTTVDSILFSKCYNNILDNISDTYSRLSTTDEFHTLIESKKLQQELQNKFAPTTTNNKDKTTDKSTDKTTSSFL